MLRKKVVAAQFFGFKPNFAPISFSKYKCEITLRIYHVKQLKVNTTSVPSSGIYMNWDHDDAIEFSSIFH